METPFPWKEEVLFTPADFNSPGDLVLQLIDFHFQVKGTRHIFEILPNENALIYETLPIRDNVENESSFAKVVHAVGVVSQHCMDSTVTSMTTWRTSMNPFIDFQEEKSKQKTRTVEEINQAERQGIIVDYIFSEVMKRVIKHYDGENVKEKTIDQLEDAIIRFCTATPHCKSEVALKNREYVKNSFRYIIGLIAKYRIGPILSKFLNSYQANLKNPSIVLSLIDGLSELAVNIKKEEEVNALFSILPTIETNLKVWVVKMKKIEIKAAICTFIAGLLSPCVHLQSISNDAKSQATKLLETIEEVIKKSKSKHYHLLPIAVSVICLCDSQFFYSKFDFLLESLVIQHKDPQLRTMCLEALFNLLFASLTKFQENNEARRSKIRSILSLHLFPAKKPLSYELEQIDIILDILEILALTDVDQIIINIILPLLQVSQALSSELLIFGVYSLLRILNRQKQFIVTSLSPKILFHPHSHHSQHRKHSLNVLKENTPVEPASIGESQLLLLSQYLSQSIQTLNQSIGNLLLISGDIKQFDHLPKEKQLHIFALEAAIAATQIVIPSSITSNELFYIISKSMFHIYSGVESVSSQILLFITQTKPNLRSVIVGALCKTTQLLPDSQNDLMLTFAKFVQIFLNRWRDEVTSKENDQLSHTIPDSTFAQLDAIAIFFLCQPLYEMKLIAMEILRTNHSLAVIYNPLLSPTCMITLIEKFSKDAITSGYTWKSAITTDPLPRRLPSFADLMDKLQKEPSDSIRLKYSRVIAKYISISMSKGAYETGKALFNMIKDRIIPLSHSIDIIVTKHEEQSSSSNINNLGASSGHAHNSGSLGVPNQLYYEKLYLWRTYITVGVSACEALEKGAKYDLAISNDQSNSSIGSSNNNSSSNANNNDNNNVIENTRDLLRHVVSFIRADNAERRLAAESAITYLSLTNKVSMMMEMSTMEKTLFDEKTRNRSKLSYSIILSYLYRIIIDISNGYLLDHDRFNLKQFFHILKYQIDKIEKILVGGGGGGDHGGHDNPLDIQFWRYNICTSISLLFQEINDTKHIKCREEYDNDTFDLCFSFLSRCSGYNSDALNDIKTKDKKLLVTYFKDKPYEEQHSLKAIFEDQFKAVQDAASSAMVYLCYAPCDDDELKRKFSWISYIFSFPSNLHKYARNSIINILKSNKEKRSALFASLIDDCYSGDLKGTHSFSVIAEIYMTGSIPIYPSILLTLGLHKLCDPNDDIRRKAVTLLTKVCHSEFIPLHSSSSSSLSSSSSSSIKEKEDDDDPFSFISSSSTVYDTSLSHLLRLSEKIATDYPAISLPMVEEIIMRFRIVDDIARSRFLHVLLPFMKNINFNSLPTDQSCHLIETLCIITAKFGDLFSLTFQQLWYHLATTTENVIFILNFLIQFCVQRRCGTAITVGEKISLLLSRIQCQPVLQKLIVELFSIDKVGRMISEEEHQELTEQNINNVTKQSWARDSFFVFPTILKKKPFSRSNIAMMFMQGVVLEHFDAVLPSLPFLLSSLLLSMDSGNERVTQSYLSFLHHLHFHVSKHIIHHKNNNNNNNNIGNDNDNDDDGDSTSFSLLNETFQFIITEVEIGWNKTDFQKNIDITPQLNPLPDKSSRMGELITALIKFTTPLNNNIQSDLMMCVLKWATVVTTSSHLITRSLQIYQYLQTGCNEENLYYLLTILHSYLSTRNTKLNQNTMAELLIALQCTAYSSSSHQLISHLQLWITALACLLTDDDKEYAHVINLISILLSRLDLQDKMVVNSLSAPSIFSSAMLQHGLQPSTLKGLLSPHADASVRILFSQLSSVSCHELVDTTSTSLVNNTVVLLPYILYHRSSASTSIQLMAKSFSSLNFPSLSSLLLQFDHGEIESEEFITKFCGEFYSNFVVGNDIHVFSLLFYSLLFGAKRYTNDTIKVFEKLYYHVDISSSPLQKNIMGLFYHLLDMMEKDYWRSMLNVYNTIIENSKQVEKYEFVVLPNPSTIARIIEKFQPIVPPWTYSDAQKDITLSILSQELKTKRDPNYMNVSEYGEVILSTAPVLSKNTIYASHDSSSSCVINLQSQLLFKDEKIGDESNNNILLVEELQISPRVRSPNFPPPPDYQAPPTPKFLPNSPPSSAPVQNLRIGVRAKNSS